MPKLFTDEDKTILFEGVDIADDNQNEFMVKMESMITSKVSELKTKLNESFEAEKDGILVSHKKEITEDMETKIDSYLDYVVETWVEDNEIALDAGIKSEILEGFVSGLKDLYEDNNINLDEESIDVVAKADEKINELQGDLAESITKIGELKESIEDFKRGIIIDKYSDGLTESQIEKLDTLVEGIEFGSDETFNEKVKIIRESYFKEEKDDDDDDGDKDDDDSTDLKKKKKEKVDEAIKLESLNEDYISKLAKRL